MIQRMFVTLDTKKTNYKNVGKINHGDDLILELTVLSDGDMISFNDPMVDLLVKKSDGKMIRQNSGIEHIKPNKFIIEVSKDCVTSPGLTTNQLIINDNGRISTCMFYYTILNSLEEDIIQSISNVEVLEQLDEYVIEARERMELLNNDINELEELFGATSDKLVEAEQNRVQSEILRVNNENDRIEADNIRNQNELDRSSSELVREQRESERILNEEERRQNESERMIDESTRQRNENARQSNESIRMSNEIDRKTQENRRVTAETNRVNAETTRRNNENIRISNETERQKAMNEMKSLIDEAEQNENIRQSNESIRISNETDRKIQENIRVTAETNRVTAETNRVNAETTRRNNENIRISNETERQKTIEEMKRLIDEVNSFVEDGIDDMRDSKTDFFGKEHDKLNTRLNADFDNVHQRINESELLPYEGASIKADNSYYGLQKDTVIKGRTLQNVIHGKNIIMDASDNTLRTISLQANLLKIKTVYTFIFNVKRNTLTRVIRTMSFEGEFLPAGTKLIEAGQTGIVKIVITTTDTMKPAIGISTDHISGIESGTQAIEFDLMVLEGDHTQTPLEELPYIEGIESTGKGNKNLLDYENPILVNKYYGASGKIIENSELKTFKIPVEYGKNYTTKICNGGSFFTEWNNDTFISYGVKQGNQILNYTPSTNEVNNIRYTIFDSSATIECKMFNNGTSLLPYEPYYDYDGYKISGKSCGKNLFDGAFEEGQINSQTGEEIAYNGRCRSVQYVSIEPNKTYTVSMVQNVVSAPWTSIRLYKDNTFIKTVQDLHGKANFTFESGEANRLRVTANVPYNDVVNCQIEEGTQATPYEPYQESNYSYILNEPLRSLPNGVCDEIDLTTGVLTRRVKKVVLDGSENWKIQSTNTNENGLVNFSLNNNFKRREGYKGKDTMCDRFPIGAMISDEKGESYHFGEQTLYIRKFISSNITTVSDFKQWLQANPTTVYYELAEPTTEQLTPQQLKSFDTTTHVISDNKLMPIVSTKIHSNVQAIISTLKLENSDLKNNVEVLSVENEELKETNIVQDEMIDISMMATDEMYSMLEPLLENTPMPMAFEREVSKLVYLYVAMVQRGLKTLDEVPTRYREQVRAMIQYN